MSEVYVICAMHISRCGHFAPRAAKQRKNTEKPIENQKTQVETKHTHRPPPEKYGLGQITGGDICIWFFVWFFSLGPCGLCLFFSFLCFWPHLAQNGQTLRKNRKNPTKHQGEPENNPKTKSTIWQISDSGRNCLFFLGSCCFFPCSAPFLAKHGPQPEKHSENK